MRVAVWLLVVVFVNTTQAGLVLPAQVESSPSGEYSVSQSEWTILTVDNTSGSGNHCSIAVDGSNWPRVSYQNSIDEVARYAQWTGDSWEIETVDNTTKTGYITSIVVDDDDVPHISYGARTFGATHLRYAYRNESVWQTETVDTVNQGNAPSLSSIDLDSGGNPHVGYTLAGMDDNMRYAVRENGSWSSEVIRTGGIAYRGLKIDNQDTPHIAFVGGIHPGSIYGHRNESGWAFLTINSSSGIARQHLALSPNDVPYTSWSYAKGGGWFGLKITWKEGDSFVEEDVGVESQTGINAITFDSQGNLHLVYIEITEALGAAWLMHGTREAGSWSFEYAGVIDYAGSYQQKRDLDLAVDSNDLPHITFTERNESTVMYATKANIWEGGDIVADAGPDQTVNEGDTVQFDGTGSSGSSSSAWEDSFADDSKTSETHNVTIAGGEAALTPLTLSIEHTFDTDPGFVLEDDMPINEIWWNASREAIQWYTDREDLFDHYEKLVGFTPFPITDRMDFSAQVDYMYWRADTYAIGDPLLLQKNESWRLGQKHGPTNNTLLVRVYGGDPVQGDLDRLVNFMYDDIGGSEVVYRIEYDKHYSELFTSRVTWDSETRTMAAEVRDESGSLVTNGSKVLGNGFIFSKYGIGSYGEGEIDNKPHIGEGLADNISIKAFGYETPGWIVSETISSAGLLSWGVLDVEVTEPERTEIEIQVLDETGSPVMQDIHPGDCPLALDGLVDPILFPTIKLKAILTTERNETPSLLSWRVTYEVTGTLDFEWDFSHLVDSNGDGNYTNDVDATGPTPTHIYYDDGVYVATLTVTDASGLSDWDTCNITVLNVAPTPEWTSQSSDGTILNPPYPEGKMILFTATVSDPGIYDTFTYDWDFGDGTVLFDAGPSVTHAYGDDDLYIVVLTVTDDDGGVGIDDTPPLETTNEDPVASIDMPFCIFTEGTDPCAPIGQFTDPGWLDTHTAVWDYGDGAYETAVLTEENDPPDATGWNITSHIYGDDGTYTITFTVTDDDGGVGSASAEAQVMNLPPTLEMDASLPVNEGEDLILDITATDPGSDDIILTIDWGDGSIETMTYYNDGIGPDPPNSGEGVCPFVVTANLTHVYGDNGDFLIQVTAEDDDGGVVEESTTAEVLNLPPEITILAIPTSINENEEFTLLVEATDPGSDDIEISWTFEMGPSTTTMFYNDGIGPDPPMSPWGTYPFTAQDSATHNYGDNGVYEVTITATDDDGGVAVHQVTVTVDNVAPTAEVMQYYLNASFAFRIAGEKWHNVEIHLYEDDIEVGYADITRYPGSPNEQMADLGEFSIDFSKTYSAVAYYTPEDDPINGQIWGATPAWIILEYEDGEERIHHTFNVRHEDTWTWEIEDLSPYFLGHNITFIATASDPGSDDLTFMWDWGDGNITENTYYNDGMGPDPYPSPEVNPITVTDTVQHAYALAGTYTITLTVMDDDGGVATYSLNLML